MMFFKVKMSHYRFRRCNYKKKKGRNSVFRKKETKNNRPSNMFRGFQATKMVRLIFLTRKDSIKGKCYVFSG